MDCITHYYNQGKSPEILILTPYRAQHNLISKMITRHNPNNVRVSTIDAAQGQEADIVIISFVRANASGNAEFTDDANLSLTSCDRCVDKVAAEHMCMGSDNRYDNAWIF